MSKRNIEKHILMNKAEAQDLQKKAKRACLSEGGLIRLLLKGYEPKEKPDERFYDVMRVVAIAGGVGCSLACFVNEKLSKDRTYVNVIMSDDLEEMKRLRDFLALHHITNVATDSYTLDWDAKTITITAYPETKAESRLINNFIEESETKFKRVIQPA